MNKVVVFGAGMVAGEHVRYLLDHGFEVTVASRTIQKAQALVKGYEKGHATAVNSEDLDAVGEIIKQHDLAVSLLPYAYHPSIARLCLKHGKHMLTTSYVKPEMAALDAPAKEAGLIFMNEIGVDPGIDHMTAMKVIHKVQKEGGEVTKFISYCGGLPAPEANDNPFGYKFSWSPRGVLLAGKNPAHYRWNSEEVDIKAGTLFDYYGTMSVEVEGKPILFETYPNRDSMPYAKTYGIESTKTMLRGTLRNIGWCSTLSKISDLGLLDEEGLKDFNGKTWLDLMHTLAPGDEDVRSNLAKKLGVQPDAKVIENLAWLGLLSNEALPKGQKAPIDMLCSRMMEKMQFAPGERDLLILRHEFEAAYSDRKAAITSLMVDFGIPRGATSMARTVGLPAAIGVRMILENKVRQRGVVIPIYPEIYEPVLDELGTLGIHFSETWTEA
ncbi:MAG: saccharopine dehydrogenase C-terminal domain-containing protein [Spirochaetia bacterium]|jgi:saccharopine dehydrogenase-like NADP-dependent oxidoreductase|nr:saccharopine dehydrogenase C-terminal domain-containing protein [Spirochaetia bacterium]